MLRVGRPAGAGSAALESIRSADSTRGGGGGAGRRAGLSGTRARLGQGAMQGLACRWLIAHGRQNHSELPVIICMMAHTAVE